MGECAVKPEYEVPKAGFHESFVGVLIVVLQDPALRKACRGGRKDGC